MRMAASWSWATLGPAEYKVLWRDRSAPRGLGSARALCVSLHDIRPLAGRPGVLRVKARAYARPLGGYRP